MTGRHIAREGGAVEPVACVIRGALANAGCGDEVYLYTPEDFHPEDDELIYDQSAIDTLRAQLEAAEAECRTRREDYATLTALWKADSEKLEARAEAAEADAARWVWFRDAVMLDGIERRQMEGVLNDGVEYDQATPAQFDAAIDAARTKEVAP